jgi:hypothetical protein
MTEDKSTMWEGKKNSTISVSGVQHDHMGVGVPTDLGTICFYRVIVPTDRYRNDTHHPYHKYKDNDHKYGDQEHGDDSAHDK